MTETTTIMLEARKKTGEKITLEDTVIIEQEGVTWICRSVGQPDEWVGSGNTQEEAINSYWIARFDIKPRPITPEQSRQLVKRIVEQWRTSD